MYYETHTNALHSATHLLIGAAGLTTYRNFDAAKAFTLVIGVAYAALSVLGLIFGVRFLGGLLPLNGWDHVLHILTALVAFGAYFASRGTVGTASASR